ncbi:MAG: hypothetical protein HZB53_03960 [Chloroflexi bacterium]|nr:hypothetical protein [Chloroflexota bacterium]
MSAYTRNLTELFTAVGVPNTAAMRVRISGILQDVLGLDPGSDDAVCNREVQKYWTDPAKRQALIEAVVARWNGDGDWQARLSKWQNPG